MKPGSITSKQASSTLQELTEANRLAYPAVIGFFLTFLLLERLVPGFFTYLLPEWYFITPLVLSSIWYLFSKPSHKYIPVPLSAAVILTCITIVAVSWRLITLEPVGDWLAEAAMVGLGSAMTIALVGGVFGNAAQQVELLSNLKNSGRRIRPYLMPIMLTPAVAVCLYLLVRTASDPFFQL